MRPPSKRTIGANKPSSEYLIRVDLAHPVIFTVSGTKTNGEFTAIFESVMVMVDIL